MRVRIMLIGGPFDGQDVLADITQLGQGIYKCSGVSYTALDKVTSDGLRLFQAMELEDSGGLEGVRTIEPAQMPVHHGR